MPAADDEQGIQLPPDQPRPRRADDALDDNDAVDDVRLQRPNVTMAVWSHWGGYLTAFVAPLVFYLSEKDKHSFVAWHAREALNFQLTMLVYLLIAVLLPIPLCCLMTIEPAFVGVALMASMGLTFIWAVYMTVIVLLASLAAARGERYRYPLTIPFVQPPTDEVDPYDNR